MTRFDDNNDNNVDVRDYKSKKSMNYHQEPSRRDITNFIPTENPQPDIVLAAKNGNLFLVQSIVESAKDEEERRRLVNASRRWTHVNPHPKRDDGIPKEYEWHDETALLAAVAADCSETVEYLLRQCADPTLEACPDVHYHVRSEDIIHRRITLQTQDTPENYLSNHNPSFIQSTSSPSSPYSSSPSFNKTDTPLELAQIVFKRAHGHLRAAHLLQAALKFWNKADYSSARYSKARDFSGYSNQPRHKEALFQALDQVPPLPEPTEEILLTLVAQIKALRERKVDSTPPKGERKAPKRSRSIDSNSTSNSIDWPTKKPTKKLQIQQQKKKLQQQQQKKQKQSSFTHNKNNLCRFYARGDCRRGDQCQFRHET